jgi:hypothetical protein
MSEMKIKCTFPVTIFEDNEACRSLAIHPAVGKSKYLELKMALIRELVELKIISILRVISAENIADFFTKPLPIGTFLAYRTDLGFFLIHSI